MPLIDRISEEQLLSWMEYDNEIGIDHDDNWRAGVIASTILNSQRSSKKDKVWTPYDMPLNLIDPRKQIQPKAMTKDEWKEYKSMLKLCGKVVKKRV